MFNKVNTCLQDFEELFATTSSSAVDVSRCAGEILTTQS